ncbi:MAG: sugar phosphate isomerase/epimerase family protein, partial [Armatimonadota bacterium]|nr:sugar phosphate isomerase/epimerase family protein [Armatimonadota bacterium]
MTCPMNRRAFLSASALAAAGWAAGLPQRSDAQPAFKHALRKALIVGKPTAEALKPIKDAGFDGVEAGVVTLDEAREARRVAEEMGLRIHSVLPRGWADLNNPDPQKAEASRESLAVALRTAQAYGATAVLVVPGRIGGMPMPEPWEFRVKFDPRSCHVTAVVEGDNAPYRAYMDEHNRSVDCFRQHLQRLIPVAEESGVVMAVENVWNNLFVDPYHFAAFIDSFASPWVKVYFDLGNHVKYGPTETWVRILGKRIAKCHVKDFKLNPDGRGGKFVDIRDGSVNWPVVRRALDDIDYADFMTIEGSGGLSREEQSRRLDLI